MAIRIRRVGWAALSVLPLALAASEARAPDGIAQAAMSQPNYSAEQRIAMMRAHQAKAHPMWRELTPAERLSRFLMFSQRALREKLAATGGQGSEPAKAPFQGNLTLIEGPAGSTMFLQRQADCSLSLGHGSYTLSLSNPAIDVQGTTAQYHEVLNAAAGLGSSAGSFPRGCTDATLGIGSRRGVYLGRTSANQLLFAASGYNYVAASNALYYGSIDAATQTVSAFHTDLSVPELGALAAGDLDGDGLSDIVGVDRFTGAVAVWRMRSNGRVGAVTRYTLPGTRTHAVVVADVDGDDRLDIVAASADDTAESLSVLNGRGDGSFAAARSVGITTPGGTFGPRIVNLVAADLRGRGRPDIVGSNGLVMLNDGSGAFTQAAFGFAATLATSAFGPNLAAGDFDADGKVDVAVNDGVSVALFHGRGDGRFVPGLRYASNDSVGYLSATDLNGDGHLDLYIGLANGGFFGGDQFSVKQSYALLGLGDGRFLGAPVLPFVYTGSNLSDLDGDGILDAVTAHADRSFGAYRGDGRGGFTLMATLPGGPVDVGGELRDLGDIESFALADFDGDGRKDLVYRPKDFIARGPGGFYTGGLLLARGTAGGGFGAPAFLPAPSFLGPGDIDIDPRQSRVRSADLDGDGKADLIYNYTVSSYDTSTYQVGIAVQLGRGDGSFAPAQVIPYHVGPNATGFARESSVQLIADLNRDGKPDLLLAWMTDTTDRTLGGFVAELRVALGRGDGSFDTPAKIDGPQRLARYIGQAQAVPAAVADMNADGHPDLVVLGGSDSYGTQIAVLLGQGDGSFRPPLYKSFAGQFLDGQGLAVGDFNADGKPDVVVTDAFIASNSGISFGNGDGTLQSLGSATVPAHNLRIDVPAGGPAIALDLSGDGRLDVLSGNTLLLAVDGAGAAPPAFAMAPASVSGSVRAGESVQTRITLTPGTGFSGAVSFSCAGLPAGASCSFAPPTLQLGAAPQSTVLTISTSAGNATAVALPAAPDPRLPAGLALALGTVVLLRRESAAARRIGLLAALALGAAALHGCGGDGNGGAAAAPGATPAGSYPLQVTASDGSIGRSFTYTLVVN